MLAFILKKIQNQFTKLNWYFEHKRMEKFKLDLKFCGEHVFIQQPVRLEGKKHISIGDNVSINAFVHMWGQGRIQKAAVRSTPRWRAPGWRAAGAR